MAETSPYFYHSPFAPTLYGADAPMQYRNTPVAWLYKGGLTQAVLIQLRGPREHCTLHQCSLGQRPDHKRICALKSHLVVTFLVIFMQRFLVPADGGKALIKPSPWLHAWVKPLI